MKRYKPAWNKGLKGYNKGYPRTKEWCEKISRAKMGHAVSEETRKKISEKQKGRVSNRKGVKLSNETKEKIRKAKLGSRNSEESIKKMKETSRIRGVNRGEKNGMFGRMSGKQNPNWKGGITSINQMIRSSLEYKSWRESVFERDNYTCIWCSIRSGNGKAVILHADHIQPFSLFPKLRFDTDNGRTLCEPCHRKTETWGTKIRNHYMEGVKEIYAS